MKASRIVDAVGNALILQLCFAICAVPSVVALQGSLGDHRAGERTGLAPKLWYVRPTWTSSSRSRIRGWAAFSSADSDARPWVSGGSDGR